MNNWFVGVILMIGFTMVCAKLDRVANAIILASM
jgi:hypothetical protein